MSLIADLKQRKLFQWAVAYLAGAWVLMQLVDVLGARWGVSDSVARIIDVVLVIGFFVTLVLAWYHGDQGHQKVTGPELLIITALLTVGGLGLVLLNPEKDSAGPAVVQSIANEASDETPWIAVLPFNVQTQDPELKDFAAGLTEDISTGLSNFSYLLVLSRGAIVDIAEESDDVRQIGSELGARYVLQGALRKAGSTTRITAQLVDAINGTQIWAETFDRELTSDDMLTIQDELTDQIVATVADPAGIVVRTLAAPTDRKAAADLTAYEAVLRYFLFQQRISAEDHLITRTALERAVETDPGYADAWTSLSLIYQQEYMNNLNPQAGSLERGLKAAQRAVDLDPASSRAHFALTQVSYFKQDLSAFQVHAERAIELNPRNTDTMAMVGIMMGYAGDWARSVELTTTAMKLNPHHPGWYYFNTFYNEYRQKNYEEALIIAQKINLPEYWAAWQALVIANAQLGREQGTKNAVEGLYRTWPNFDEEYIQRGIKVWIFNQPDLLEQIVQGMSLAGIHLEGP
jgi:TolB-like protein/Tfp pilus assembly protein PilF